MTPAPRITIHQMTPDGGSLVSFRSPPTPAPTANQIVGDLIHDIASAITLILFFVAAIVLAINFHGGTI